jgi:hypothetical protein
VLIGLIRHPSISTFDGCSLVKQNAMQDVAGKESSEIMLLGLTTHLASVEYKSHV